jgi:hypothetical protein
LHRDHIRETSPARLPAFLALLTLTLAVGCGGPVADENYLDADLANVIEAGLGVGIKQVECPSGISLQSSQVFECRVLFRASNDASQVRVAVQAETENRRARFRVVGLEDK